VTGLVCSLKAMDNSGIKDPWQKVAGSEGRFINLLKQFAISF